MTVCKIPELENKRGKIQHVFSSKDFFTGQDLYLSSFKDLDRLPSYVPRVETETSSVMRA